MDSAWKPAIQAMVLLLLGGFNGSRCAEWCYDEPSCGPKTWHCGGSEQSPINILTQKTIPNSALGPIHFIGYEDQMRPTVLQNTGHYANIKMKSGATISGPGLPATYHLKSFHFHWGTYRTHGSEHAIDGQRYSMELHLVHTKNNMTEEEAAKEPIGFAVVAFFIERCNDAPIVSAWKTLGNLIEKIPEQGDSVQLNGAFSLGGLLHLADVNMYYRYHGSLTTPNCTETVIWTVYPEPIQVRHSVVKKFTSSLYFTTKKEGRQMEKNYRPLQERRGRKVYCFKENEFPCDQDCL